MTAPVWILSDHRTGNVNQCLGVAEQLGLPFIIKDIRYTPFSRLPNWLLGSSLLGLDKNHSTELLPPWPKVIIAAGRRTAPIARYIKQQNNGKSFWVQLMWPGFPTKDIDLLALPIHDDQKEAPNHIFTLGAPHRITEDSLSEAERYWKPRLSRLHSPRIALLVGGVTKEKPFTLTHGEMLASQIEALLMKVGGSIMVTTSRRTPSKVIDLLKNRLSVFPNFFYDWREGAENPYLGMLATADMIVVTGDSMSMCSEACATAKPVFIFTPAGFAAKKHARFHHSLFTQGYALPLHELQTTESLVLPPRPALLNEAARIAGAIQREL